MGIWTYDCAARHPTSVWCDDHCAFCDASLLLVDRETCKSALGVHEATETLHACPLCGWWRLQREALLDDRHMFGRLAQPRLEKHPRGRRTEDEFPTMTRLLRGAAGSLRNLALTDVSVPLEDVRAYLTGRYEQRFGLPPSVLEETVASVFANVGYSVQVTGKSGDDGIDVVLSKGEEVIGVQVKRYSARIQVDQIRAFAGALMVNGLTKGVFVTTSDFTRGAPRTVSKLAERGYRIELYDAVRFLDALKISQRASASSAGVSLKDVRGHGLQEIAPQSQHPSIFARGQIRPWETD